MSAQRPKSMTASRAGPLKGSNQDLQQSQTLPIREREKDVGQGELECLRNRQPIYALNQLDGALLAIKARDYGMAHQHAAAFIEAHEPYNRLLQAPGDPSNPASMERRREKAALAKKLSRYPNAAYKIALRRAFRELHRMDNAVKRLKLQNEGKEGIDSGDGTEAFEGKGQQQVSGGSGGGSTSSSSKVKPKNSDST